MSPDDIKIDFTVSLPPDHSELQVSPDKEANPIRADEIQIEFDNSDADGAGADSDEL